MFKDFFTKSKNEDNDILELIELEPENWKGHWKTVYEENQRLSSIGISEYLNKNPEKESIFLRKLKNKSNELNEIEQKKRNPKLVWTLGVIGSFAIFFIAIFFQSEYSQQPIDFSVKIREFSGNVEIVRSNQTILSEKGTKIISGDSFQIKNSKHFVILQSSDFILFKVTGPANIDIKEIPSDRNQIGFYIKKGIISIDSKPVDNKPSVYWKTDHFTYSPMGTIAKLLVMNGKENLTVENGSFSILDIKTGEIEIANAGSTIEKKFNEISIKKSPIEDNENTPYGLLQTITLKNGKRYTGYFYTTENKSWIQTEKEKIMIKNEEIENRE
jgi:hypothetical protein